jgi:hypothetical protein
MIKVILIDVTILFFLIFMIYECAPKFCAQTHVPIQDYLIIYFDQVLSNQHQAINKELKTIVNLSIMNIY